MNKFSATINHDEMILERTKYRLAESKRMQGKAICNHYIKLYYTVQTLHDVIEFNEQCNGKDIDLKPIDEYIDYLIDKIKKEHEIDFGIKLEWNNE